MAIHNAQSLATEALLSQLCGEKIPNRHTTEAVLKILEPDDARLRAEAVEYAEHIFRAVDDVV